MRKGKKGDAPKENISGKSGSGISANTVALQRCNISLMKTVIPEIVYFWLYA